MGEKYGPVVYEELQSRLEKTIDIFHKDVDKLFSSFSTYKLKDNKGNNSKGKKLGKTVDELIEEIHVDLKGGFKEGFFKEVYNRSWLPLDQIKENKLKKIIILLFYVSYVLGGEVF